MQLPLLSIVIVSFNTRELLRRCLLSVFDNPAHRIPEAWAAATYGPAQLQSPSTPEPIPIELLVVDNDSKDGSAEMVSEQFPGVRLIRLGANAGFARASNAGLRESRGELLLLLNPDTELLDSALVQMAGFLTTHPSVGAVGPALVYPDGRHQHAAFRFPTLWMSLFDFFPMNHQLIDSRLNGRYPIRGGDTPFPIDHPLGAAIMMKRETLEEVGLLDEAFFMYCEEIDWCMRAKRSGWQIYQVPSARVIHHAAQSSRQFREKMLVELHKSRYRLFRKHYSPAFVAAHRAITRLGIAREIARARWQAHRGQISRDELERRLWAYHTIWSL